MNIHDIVCEWLNGTLASDAALDKLRPLLGRDDLAAWMSGYRDGCCTADEAMQAIAAAL